MPDRILRRHDTHRYARALLMDENGSPIDLDGSTVAYTMKHQRTRELKIDRASATLADQDVYPGEIYYAWDDADVDTAGTYIEEWEITYSDTTKETFPASGEQRVLILPDEDDT